MSKCQTQMQTRGKHETMCVIFVYRAVNLICQYNNDYIDIYVHVRITVKSNAYMYVCKYTD